MYDGYFVFDNVVHMFDNRPSNAAGEAGREMVNFIWGAGKLFSGGPYKASETFDSYMSVEEAHKILFEDADTDMAIAQTVPLYGWFKQGFSPAAANHSLAAAYPDKVVFCGGVDPIYQGSRGALDEMDRQAKEWNAKSFKFYQSQMGGNCWRVDDRHVAYPLWEKCLELGVTSVQFHKGLPFGPQLLEHQHPGDIERAAIDFPELTFIIHHLGQPFVAETINITSRHKNVMMSMSAWINMFPIQPRACLHQMGQALLFCGPDKLMYGSEAFVWPSLQPYIELFAKMEMPEDLQEGYGYPALTREIKQKIFGENQARLLGIDVEKKKKELAKKSSRNGDAKLKKTA